MTANICTVKDALQDFSTVTKIAFSSISLKKKLPFLGFSKDFGPFKSECV